MGIGTLGTSSNVHWRHVSPNLSIACLPTVTDQDRIFELTLYWLEGPQGHEDPRNRRNRSFHRKGGNPRICGTINRRKACCGKFGIELSDVSHRKNNPTSTEVRRTEIIQRLKSFKLFELQSLLVKIHLAQNSPNP
jgi:hypothetical protein